MKTATKPAAKKATKTTHPQRPSARLSARLDRSLIRPPGNSARYLAVELTAPSAPKRKGRIPVNVALVLDRSGSMAGEKIVRAREAAVQAIRSLHDEDRFSIVIYDDAIDVLVPSTKATAQARRQAEGAVRDIEARNTTALCEGWLRGCEQVADHLDAKEVGRCLLLTDGLANVGITDPDTIVRHASELRERHVATTTFGVGADFDEVLLRRMAEAGGGNFYFIERGEQIPDFVASELGEALEVVARRATLSVAAEPGVRVECLNDFPVTRARRDVKVSLGDLVSRQELSLVVKLTFPEGEVGAEQTVRLGLADEDDALRLEAVEIVFTYASHAKVSAQPRDRAVDRTVAALYAARASREALEHNRDGDFEGARRILTACQRRIREYAGDDPEMLAIIESLEARKVVYHAPMAALDRKIRYSVAVAEVRSRLASGAARRTAVKDKV